jgi:hypothetical protein
MISDGSRLRQRMSSSWDRALAAGRAAPDGVGGKPVVDSVPEALSTWTVYDCRLNQAIKSGLGVAHVGTLSAYSIARPTDRVTRASIDHPPHNVAAMFDQVADR